MARALVGLALAATLSTCPRAAAQAPEACTAECGIAAPSLSSDEVQRVLALPGSASTSRGAPGTGRLEGAVALPSHGPGFLHNPKRPIEARYATAELVQALMRAAALVHHELPGSEVVINDLGLEHGGPIAQHGSHQAGRDVDVLFYALDGHGEPMPAVGVPIEPDGRGWDFKNLADPKDDVRVRLDTRRTWRFVQALIESAGDDVQRIFVVEHVRAFLLAEAARAKAPAAVVRRFEELSCQPGTPHDDHMHIRFHCSVEDLAAGCLDAPPLYPWRRAALRQLGIQARVEHPARTSRDRAAVRKRTTTPEAARAKAGAMHSKVRAFLDRRRAWLEQPHPGRPFCR